MYATLVQLCAHPIICTIFSTRAHNNNNNKLKLTHVGWLAGWLLGWLLAGFGWLVVLMNILSVAVMMLLCGKHYTFGTWLTCKNFSKHFYIDAHATGSNSNTLPTTSESWHQSSFSSSSSNHQSWLVYFHRTTNFQYSTDTAYIRYFTYLCKKMYIFLLNSCRQFPNKISVWKYYTETRLWQASKQKKTQ